MAADVASTGDRKRILLLAPPTRTAASVFRKDIQDEILTRLGRDRTHGFLATMLQQCEAIAPHVAADGVDLERMAHDLASTSGMLGFEDLSHRCRDVLVATDASTHRHALAPLSESLARAIAILRDQLQSSAIAA